MGVGAYTPTRRVNLYVQNKTLVNGALDLEPENWIYRPHAFKYETWTEMLTAFLTDFYNYLGTKQFIDTEAISVTDFIHGAEQTEGFGGIWPSKFGTTAADPTYGVYRMGVTMQKNLPKALTTLPVNTMTSGCGYSNTSMKSMLVLA